jgi:hypothetical protein
MLLERGIALFVHLVGVITLFVAMALIQLSGARVRSSSTVEEVRTWLGLVRPANRLFPIASLLILASGLYMTARMWSFDLPWVLVAIGAVVVMGIVGGRVVGQGLGRIASAATGTGPVSDKLAALAHAPGPWAAATAVNGMGLAVVWIMARKSGWVESIAALAGLAALGAMAGARMARGRAPRQELVREPPGSEAKEVSA